MWEVGVRAWACVCASVKEIDTRAEYIVTRIKMMMMMMMMMIQYYRRIENEAHIGFTQISLLTFEYAVKLSLFKITSQALPIKMLSNHYK